MTAGNDMATERAVRDALRGRLISTSDIREMIEEFWVPRSNERADLVAIGESLDGFEIKTARDTLRRLPGQSAAYGRVFDRCTVVVAEKHLDAATGLLPEWWGITRIADEARITFLQVRSARPNPSLDAEVLVRLLWRDEVMSALLRLGSQPNHRSSRGSLWNELLDSTSPAQLRTIVREAILNRDPTLARIRTRRFTASSVAVEAGP